MEKRGQLTVFIILGILIVASIILIFAFYPQVRINLGLQEENPYLFITNCLKDELRDNVYNLSMQGGSLEPELYYEYNNAKIEYLCYTGEYYLPCVMQQPMLKNHIESEIKRNMAQSVDLCFNNLRINFDKRGYTVNLRKGDFGVELLPERVTMNFNTTLTLKKDSTTTYDRFNVAINNNLYELVSIANSILNYEARYGDSETTVYMNYYRDLKVEKKKQSEGTTIYILTNRFTGQKFQFASRSVAWPPGFGE